MVFARNAPVLSTPEAMAASDWVHKVKIGPLLIVVHNEIRLRHTITLYSIPSNENQSMITSCGYTRKSGVEVADDSSAEDPTLPVKNLRLTSH